MATIEDLITAVEEGDEDEVKEALKESPAIVFKADPATGLRALHVAAWRGDGDVARILLKNGAEIDWQDEKYGNTALIWAAYRGYTDVSAAPPWPARAAPRTARCRAAVPPPPGCGDAPQARSGRRTRRLRRAHGLPGGQGCEAEEGGQGACSNLDLGEMSVHPYS